jgi:hypothetical protein
MAESDHKDFIAGTPSPSSRAVTDAFVEHKKDHPENISYGESRRRIPELPNPGRSLGLKPEDMP